MNALAALKCAEALGVPLETIRAALASLVVIPGRAERIPVSEKILAVVDYAHTPDSLRALYEAFPTRRKICVLGNTGGGRDTWKRPEMAKIAEEYCAEVILTDEDPYDEGPEKILKEMANGMIRPPHIILHRREAIRTALSLARDGDAILISGKGTDPYIMRANGAKESWSDATVVREEINRMKSTKA
jgi:UDP-N-acetylmuramoyl-L-alanyl-D-glutamate--2,6-diaminopimelate ligase